MNEIALIGKKIGMTREFYKTGQLVPVTVLKMEKARVIQVIEEDKRGYKAVQLGFGKINESATGNNDYGYFAGGRGSASGWRSAVNRIDYSNDTATASPKGPLSLARYGLAATGNSSFGYFGGGAGVSTVDRIDYSNDTETASPKGPLTNVEYGNTACSPVANGL